MHTHIHASMRSSNGVDATIWASAVMLQVASAWCHFKGESFLAKFWARWVVLAAYIWFSADETEVLLTRFSVMMRIKD